MATDTRAQEDPEMTNQDAPMPSVEQTTPAPEGGAQPTEGLPDEAKERTRREFDKLREDLRTERTRREYMETVFNSLQTKKQETPAAEPEPIYDPSTGLLNESVLSDVQKRTHEAERRAKEAEQAVQNYLEMQEKRDAFEAYPTLNPEATDFNRDLHVATRQILLDSMMNPQDYGNKQLSFKDAAVLASKRLPNAFETAKQQGAQEALEQLTPKEQAAYEATGTSGRRGDLLEDLPELQDRTRKGDLNAIVNRMNRIYKPKG